MSRHYSSHHSRVLFNSVHDGHTSSREMSDHRLAEIRALTEDMLTKEVDVNSITEKEKEVLQRDVYSRNEPLKDRVRKIRSVRLEKNLTRERLRELIPTLSVEERYRKFFEECNPTELETYIVNKARETGDVYIPLVWGHDLWEQILYEPRLSKIRITKQAFDRHILPMLLDQTTPLSDNIEQWNELKRMCPCIPFVFTKIIENTIEDKEGVKRVCLEPKWGDQNSDHRGDCTKAGAAARDMMRIFPEDLQVRISVEPYASESLVLLRTLRRDDVISNIKMDFFGRKLTYVTIVKFSSPLLLPPTDPLTWMLEAGPQLDGAPQMEEMPIY